MLDEVAMEQLDTLQDEDMSEAHPGNVGVELHPLMLAIKKAQFEVALRLLQIMKM